MQTLKLVQGEPKLAEPLVLATADNKTSVLWKIGNGHRLGPPLPCRRSLHRSYAICQLLPVADLAKCLVTLCAALDGWNDWNNWNSGTLGTRVRLKRLERSAAVELLERLERTDPVLNEAKRWNPSIRLRAG
jgi:hypothetical protein